MIMLILGRGNYAVSILFIIELFPSIVNIILEGLHRLRKRTGIHKQSFPLEKVTKKNMKVQ